MKRYLALRCSLFRCDSRCRGRVHTVFPGLLAPHFRIGSAGSRSLVSARKSFALSTLPKAPAPILRISHFKVRAATVVTVKGEDHVVLGGNTEYEIPEAIHGESSLLNHVTTLYGADATRHDRPLRRLFLPTLRPQRQLR